MGSTRLPRKVLLPFYEEKSILEIILKRLENVEGAGKIVVATTDLAQDDEIEAFCQERNVLCFRGDANDVLQRYVDAMSFFETDECIRICADNPFLEPNLLEQLILKAEKTPPPLFAGLPLDYASFKINGTPSIRTHFGIFAEYVTRNALGWAKKLGATPFDCEHVTKFVYEHPHTFRLQWLDVSEQLEDWENVRLTVDTPQDFEIAQQFYAALMQQHSDFSLDSMKHTLTEMPHLRLQMQDEIEKNAK